MQPIFTSVSDPVWADAAHTSINCNVTAVPFGIVILPFTARADDPSTAGRELYAGLVAGNYGSIGEYVPPPPPPTPAPALAPAPPTV